MKRRKFLTTLASVPVLGVLVVFYIKWLEPNWLEVTEKDISVRHLSHPLRLLHLSDFHVSPEVSLEAINEAIDLGLKQNPDLIVITGDFFTWEVEDELAYSEILKKLSYRVPCFACAGNHDGGLWAGSSHGYKSILKLKSLLKTSNIKLLHNSAETVSIGGQVITIVGLGDIWARDAKPEWVLTENRDQNVPIILLSHNPDSKEILKPYDWDLMCCGHTHGGQLVIPIFGSRPFLPVRDKSFPEGILTWGERHIHVTRGVGNLHGVRFNCRPEVSILNLVV